MCHDPPLRKTSNMVCTISGPYSRLPIQIFVDVMTVPLAIRSFWDDGLSGCSLWVMNWSATMSIALIIVQLSTTTRKSTCPPFGPCKDGMVRKGLLVYAMISFPSLSSRYTSVTPLLGITMSFFSCVLMDSLGVGWVFWVCICMEEETMLSMVYMVLWYVGMVRIAVGGEHCMEVTADPCITITPGCFPIVAISICHSIIACPV